jgi:hypothetical protein
LADCAVESFVARAALVVNPHGTVVMDRRDFLATTAAIGVSSALPSRLLGD